MEFRNYLSTTDEHKGIILIMQLVLVQLFLSLLVSIYIIYYIDSSLETHIVVSLLLIGNTLLSFLIVMKNFTVNDQDW